MNRILSYLCSALFVVNLGFGQTKIAELTFEGVPSDLAYTTNYSNGTIFPEFTNGNLNYFMITDGSNIGPTIVLANQQGSFYFGAQNIDDDPNIAGQIPLLLNIYDIDISGYTNLEFRVHLAEDDDGANQDWDNSAWSNDYVHFYYDIDNSGTFTNLIWIESGPNSGFFVSDQAPMIDTDFDGTGDGTSITSSFTQFTELIPNTGAEIFIDLQIEFSLNLSQEDIAIDNIEIWGIGSGCSTTTTWNGSNWDNGVPNSTTNTIINGDYSTQANGGGFEACNLTVSSGVLRIQDTDFVTVENDIVVDGIIIVGSVASLVQVNDLGTISVGATGDCILEKSTNPVDDWFDYTYWSSPVSNETIESVFQGVPADRIFRYDASNFDDSDGDTFDDNGNDWIIAGQTETLSSGKGYAAVADAIGMLGIQTFSFNGTFNNGIVTPSITISSGANPQHWNFLGNPYPSAIDADLFLTHSSNNTINGTIHFWTHNSDPDGIYDGIDALNFTSADYASYNLIGGVGTQAASSNGSNNSNVPTGLIASGQGFFVDGIPPEGLVTFNNSMRVTSGNDNFYRMGQNSQRTSSSTTDRVWLNLQNEYGAFSQILIGFNELATNGVDRLFDGKRLSANSYVTFYSLIENEKFAIQGLAPFTEEAIVPIGLNINIEEELQYSISIENAEGILASIEIYLKDNLLDVEHNLSDSSYIFISEDGEFNDRFEIRFANTLAINEFEGVKDLLIVNSNEQNELVFSTTKRSVIANIKIYDLLGRQLHDLDIDNDTLVRLNAKAMSNTVYIAKVELLNGRVLTKKVLKQ